MTSPNHVTDTLESIGEQITWEMLKCEGRWYVWASNNDDKYSDAAADLEDAVLYVAELIRFHHPEWFK